MEENIVTLVESYLNKYVTFAEEMYSLPCALWAIATHCWPEFDAFPYLGISARTKKAGKTTLKDCMVPLVANGEKFSVSSVSSMFRVLDESNGTFPVMFIDECEALANENHPGREFLNKGFERGEYITRTISNESKKFDCYCPKAFVGIGGVYDTLRDRSILIMMKRRTPVEAAKATRIRQGVRDGEATELRAMLSAAVKEKIYEAREMYASADMLSFLDERAEKCWTPLFIMARIFCPERIDELTRIAVDMEADKSAPMSTSSSYNKTEEEKADDNEARVLLLRDMIHIMGDMECIPTVDIIEKLKAVPTSGWRRYKGIGLTPEKMGYLLDMLNVHPKRIRPTKGSRQQLRGYVRKDIIAAATLEGLVE